ncbi:MAG TPA: SRPBCC family protein [Candidatus Dormibacteraeota bacterium]|jgi:carbon monoxide dehydrogenase subunit G|nr:SRPBCC family protein [Candidatus Dormibacteraeota bacterium]
MKVERKIAVAATPTEAFAKLSDVKLLASVLAGFMDWYPTDEPNKFRTVFRAGPAPLGGEIEIEFWPESETVVWHSTKGVQHLGRFLIRGKDIGSEITLRIYYHLDGGLASRLSETVFAPRMRDFMGTALDRLRRSIEAQPPRRRLVTAS